MPPLAHPLPSLPLLLLLPHLPHVLSAITLQKGSSLSSNAIQNPTVFIQPVATQGRNLILQLRNQDTLQTANLAIANATYERYQLGAPGLIALDLKGEEALNGLNVTISSPSSAQNYTLTYLDYCERGYRSTDNATALPLDCTKCPTGSSSAPFTSADCRCQPGYYSSTGSAPCSACPTGFVCPGHSTAQPMVKSGYQMLESVAVVECPNPIACGPNNTCAVGYAGSLCGSCQEGFYKLGRSCHKCVLGSIPFIVTAVLATIGLWILIWCLGLLWNYILVFPIAVFFLQDLAFLRIFDLQWPTSMDYLLQVASFMNFNWELAQMECIFPPVPWYFAPVAILCMPFLYFITDLIFRDIAALVYAIYAYFQHGDLPYRKFLTIGHPTNIIVFLEFSYFPLIVAAASLLDCRPLAQLPHLRLSGHVDFACYEGEHSILWPIGVAALVLYGLGIPSLEFGLEWYNRKASVAAAGQNSQAPKTYLGLLTFRYTHSNYYYFLFPHFRRLVTVLIATFTAQVDTATQAASTALWFFIAYLIQYITSSRKWKGVMGRMLGRVGEAVTTIWLHVTLVLGVGLKYMANHDNGGEDVLLVYVLWWLIIGGFILSGLLPLCELLLRRMIKAGMVKDYDLPDVTRNDRLFENGDGENYFLSSPPNVTSEEDDPEAVRRLRLDSDLAATSRSNNPQQATSLSDKALLSPSKSPADNEFSDTIRQPASLSVPVYSHSQPITTPTVVPADLSNIPTEVQLFPSNHSSEPDIKNEPAAKDSNDVSLANQTNSMFQSTSLTQSQEGNRSTSYAVIDDDPTKAFTFGKSSRFSISTQSSVRSNINGFLNEFTANGVSASRQQEGVKFDTTEDGGNGQSNDSVDGEKRGLLRTHSDPESVRAVDRRRRRSYHSGNSLADHAEEEEQEESDQDNAVDPNSDASAPTFKVSNSKVTTIVSRNSQSLAGLKSIHPSIHDVARDPNQESTSTASIESSLGSPPVVSFFPESPTQLSPIRAEAPEDADFVMNSSFSPQKESDFAPLIASSSSSNNNFSEAVTTSFSALGDMKSLTSVAPMPGEEGRDSLTGTISGNFNSISSVDKENYYQKVPSQPTIIIQSNTNLRSSTHKKTGTTPSAPHRSDPVLSKNNEHISVSNAILHSEKPVSEGFLDQEKEPRLSIIGKPESESVQSVIIKSESVLSQNPKTGPRFSVSQLKTQSQSTEKEETRSDSPISRAKSTASSNRSSKVGTLIINTPNERNNQSLPNIKAKNKSDIKGKLSPTIKVVGSISNLPPPPPLTDVTDLPLTPLSMHKLVPPPPTESTTEITVPDSRPLPAPPSPLGSEHKLPKSFSHSDFTTLSRSRNGSQKRDSKDSMSNLHPATSKAQVLEIIKQQSYSLKNVQMPTEQRKLPNHPRDVLLSQIRSSSSWCDLKPISQPHPKMRDRPTQDDDFTSKLVQVLKARNETIRDSEEDFKYQPGNSAYQSSDEEWET